MEVVDDKEEEVVVIDNCVWFQTFAFANRWIFDIWTGKRKYNKGKTYGHRRAWVLGGICRYGVCLLSIVYWQYSFSETNEIFLVECPGGLRTREVLEKIIVEHVEVGTKIITDGWKGYVHLEELGFNFENILLLLTGIHGWYLVLFKGYEWSFVNHDKWYVDPLTGDHTNKIESSWFAVKRTLPRGGKYNLKRF